MTPIELQHVGKRFGATTTLRDLSLSVAAGEFVVLVGPSGCGKSTLLRIIAGIEHADTGTVSIGGRDVTALPAAKRNVAMVFQSYALYPHLSVAANIAVPLAQSRLSAAQRLPILGGVLPGTRSLREGITRDVRAAAESLGLTPLLDRRPAQLSGGQRQRVALARAMVRRPAAFLMDEPLSNLDASLRTQARREIVEIHRRVGAPTVYVTHDQEEALTMADRVAVMQGGEILQFAPPEVVYNQPADLRVASFIGSPRINLLAAEADGDGIVRVAGQAVGLRSTVHGKLTLGLRPETLVLSGTGLAATAEAVEFLGDGLLLHARLRDTAAPVILRLGPESRGEVLPGQPLHFRFDAARALLFDTLGRRVPASTLTEPLLLV
ncbi:ABC transporter ATP-binding protein [Roseomonas elaeocarpi]|uniref:ABC transporter ATP-binding protein n=1 Tax=Roseomonas elaeocarpi TaxID=907779 RepID=A0ABV6JS70_9PROT